MRFEGIHHVTCITGDAPGNVDFYTRVLGLRMVKKTVNQDDPTVYHLFYADEAGSPGADITFFEYPGARRGRAGAGMVHTISFRVGSEEALDFWEARLGGEGIATRRSAGQAPVRRSRGPRARARRRRHHRRAACRRAPRGAGRARAAGLRQRARVHRHSRASRELLEYDARLRPHRRATSGRRAARCAAAATPTTRRRPRARASPAPARCTTSRGPRTWTSRRRGSSACAAPAPTRAGSSTASGSARSTSASRAGCCSRSRRMGPGFSIDEDAEHLGETLILPPAFEHLRAQIEPVLTPLPDPRAAWTSS